MRQTLLKLCTFFVIIGFSLVQFSCGGESSQVETVSLKEECLQTMFVLVDKLVELQINEQKDAEFGAITCPHCNVLHTRASEAVYPFAVAFKETGDKKYLNAAINTVNWLIKQQQPTGEWIETPWDWTGTTADQLLRSPLSPTS